MRVCLVLEGSYPYTFGGVSSWTNQYIKQMPDNEVVLWVINAHEKDKGKFVYELPPNVVGVNEVFLDQNPEDRGDVMHIHLKPQERKALKDLMDCGRPDWDTLFRLLQSGRTDPIRLLMSEDFLTCMEEVTEKNHMDAPFAESFHMLRSMLLPLLHICTQPIPQADIYHAISTGYAGVLASMANVITGRPMILTEHGIYAREREEEIIRSDWIQPIFKRHWVMFFRMLSNVAYTHASYVTNLYSRMHVEQESLGADPAHVRTIGNGIDYDKFAAVPAKEPDEWIDIGAVIRLAPIKDVKTLIYAYFEASRRMKNLRLHIMGGTDDADYGRECHQMKIDLKLDNLVFTGRVDSAQYMAKLDFTVLSSISEGQPLSVLESFAARRPAVTTEVGCCRELLMGDGDDYGQAGFIVMPMDRMGMADALVDMASDRDRIHRFGENGRRRVEAFYKKETMMSRYLGLYREVMRQWQE